MTTFRVFLGVCAVLLVTYQLAVRYQERVDRAAFRAHLAEQAKRSLRTMRETHYCDPPGHSWSTKAGANVGDPCQCGAEVMDESMRRALDERCEP